MHCLCSLDITFHSTHYLYAGDGRGNNINVILTVAQARVFTISHIAIVIISSLFRLPGFILSRIIYFLFWGALFVADHVDSSGHHQYVVTTNIIYAQVTLLRVANNCSHLAPLL